MKEALIVETSQGLWRVYSGDGKGSDLEQGATLIEAAREMLPRAYAPFSGFRVGAAVRMAESDELFTGCNIENASYGATMCAERTALFSGVASGGREIEALALSLDSAEEPDLARRSPCGLCRQVISEFATPDTLIFVDGGTRDGKDYTGDVLTIDDLLPWRFRLGS